MNKCVYVCMYVESGEHRIQQLSTECFSPMSASSPTNIFIQISYGMQGLPIKATAKKEQQYIINF